MSNISDFFEPYELWSKDNHVIKLDPRFEAALLHYRIKVDAPLIPNSCCRSRAHNTAVRGSSNSYHLYEDVDDGREGGMAIDLRVRDGAIRGDRVATAWKLGWSIGIYKTFIHLDRRVDLGKRQIMFLGKY